MKKYLEEYLHSMNKRGLSPATVQNSRRSIQYFFNFLKKRRISKINRHTFQIYGDYLMSGRRFKYATIKDRILPVRSYFRYLTEAKRYLFNPAAVLELPKRPEALSQDIPAPGEIVALLDAIDTTGRVNKRRKAILELLYSTGIRAKELLNLDIYDIDFGKRTLFVRNGKGNKDRVVPFGRNAAVALKDYIENARKYHAEATGETKLFLSMWGHRLRYNELIRVMPRRRNGKRLKAHSLRHACAIGMLKNGADIRYIQELLGHSSITSTQIYTRILPTHIQEVHAQYHPRALLKTKRISSGGMERHPDSRFNSTETRERKT
ncbi:MAG TPA: tyrosine-type recombinase/integrase [Candidatus Omnitrophota bacterium]|nr:tyrosine-type recombinase/integrase [Candidatus Omnitrophota bacterium]